MEAEADSVLCYRTLLRSLFRLAGFGTAERRCDAKWRFGKGLTQVGREGSYQHGGEVLLRAARGFGIAGLNGNGMKGDRLCGC